MMYFYSFVVILLNVSLLQIGILCTVLTTCSTVQKLPLISLYFTEKMGNRCSRHVQTYMDIQFIREKQSLNISNKLKSQYMV